jgi:hypothetical protein
MEGSTSGRSRSLRLGVEALEARVLFSASELNAPPKAAFGTDFKIVSRIEAQTIHRPDADTAAREPGRPSESNAQTPDDDDDGASREERFESPSGTQRILTSEDGGSTHPVYGDFASGAEDASRTPLATVVQQSMAEATSIAATLLSIPGAVPESRPSSEDRATQRAGAPPNLSGEIVYRISADLAGGSLDVGEKPAGDLSSPVRESEMAILSSRVAALLHAELPFDTKLLNQRIDHFFAQLANLGQPESCLFVSTRITLWLVVFVAAALESARRLEARYSRRLDLGGEGLVDATALFPGRKPWIWNPWIF